MNKAELEAKALFIINSIFNEITELKRRVTKLEGDGDPYADEQQDDPRPRPKEDTNSIEFDLDEAGIDLSLLKISDRFIKQTVSWLKEGIWNTVNDVLKRHGYKWVSWEVRDAQGEPVLKKDGTPKKDGRWET